MTRITNEEPNYRQKPSDFKDIKYFSLFYYGYKIINWIKNASIFKT